MNSDLLDEYCQNLFGHTNWQMDGGADGNIVITFYAKPRDDESDWEWHEAKAKEHDAC